MFPRRAFGADATIAGECVFNTSMTGYQEILTDPSYFGQIVTMTAVQIGNYGVNDEDTEAAAPKCSGSSSAKSRRSSATGAAPVARRLPRQIRHPRHQRHRHPRADEEAAGRRRDEVLP
jgi:carbamoylphosphate synthase small subunit